MAAADRFRIVVKGRQTHGARPWGGVDPIVVAAQVVTGLQTIVARQLDLTRYPAVLSVGAIKGGIRFNIIPDEVEMVGTIRSFDPEMRADIIERMTRTAKDIASSAGATAQVEIAADPIPVVVNDETLTARMRPTLERVAGADHVVPLPYSMISEDFSRYGSQAPLLFLWVGITPPGTDPLAAPANHSPKFYVDEAGLPLGLRAMLALTVDYLQGAAK
jgi:amidohydrolase